LSAILDGSTKINPGEFMKKIFFILLFLPALMISCSEESPVEDIQEEEMPVDEVSDDEEIDDRDVIGTDELEYP
jgi:hypothetical protein